MTASGAPRGLPRVVEAVLAVAGLVLALPVVAVSALAIRLDSPGPVLFRQTRVGRGGRPFRLVKLRTMRAGATGPEVTASSDVRITAVGRLLRRTKLDEIPGLWNVVRGDLSLVGPRPEVPRYVDFGDPAWQEVLTVRPGLTDPAVVAFRHEERLLGQAEIDPEVFYLQQVLPAKLKLSREYLRSKTWRSDVDVLCRTLLSMVGLSRRSAKNLTDSAIAGENPASFPRGPRHP